MNLKMLKSKKLIATFGMLVLLFGLAAGVYLTQHPQILQKKAEVTPIIFKDPQGSPLPVEDGVPVTQELNVKVQLDAP